MEIGAHTTVRANMAADLRPEQRLTDDEVLAQITTFVRSWQEKEAFQLTCIDAGRERDIFDRPDLDLIPHHPKPGNTGQTP